jgi:hypothetical protein
MKVKLHLKERFYLGNILPQENSLVDFQLKKRITEKIQVSDEEKNELGFKVNDEDNSATWDAMKDFENPKEIEFSDDERGYIRKAIEAGSGSVHPDEYWVIVGTIYDKMANKE